MRRRALALLVLLVACDAPAPFDRVQLLRETAATSIVPSYTAAAARAVTLHEATRGLCGAPSAAALAEAQHAWIDAASAWHASRPFTLRGEHTINDTLDGELTTAARIDTIEANLASTDALDAPDYVPALGGAAKGLFALEYLLFGYPDFAVRDDARTLAALGEARRCTYVVVLAADVEAVTARARDAWSPDAGNFAATFGASTSSAAYPSPQAALDDLVSSIADAVDWARDQGIGRPLGLATHAGAPESPYAHASVVLMQATIEGVRDAWTTPEHGLDALLRSRDAVLANEVLAEIDAVDVALAALASPPSSVPFESYVSGTDHAAGNAAYDALATLLTTLATDVASVLSISVTLTIDGD